MRYLLMAAFWVGLAGQGACISSPAPYNSDESLFQEFLLKFKEHEKAVARKDSLAIGTLNQAIKDLAEKHADRLLSMADGDNIEWRVVAVAALGFVRNEMHQEAVLAALSRALEDGNNDVRHNAAGSLGHLALPQTPLDKLIKLLEDPSPPVRRAASYALSLTLPPGRNEAYAASLIRSLSDTDIGVRQHAASALGRVGSVQAVEPLIKLCLQQQDRELRKNAVIALARLRYTPFTENPQEQLMDLLQSMDDAVANEAWENLKIINTVNVPLIELLKDPDTEVVKGVAESLKSINGHDFGRMYSKWKVWQEDKVQREREMWEIGIKKRKDEASRKQKEQGASSPEQKSPDANPK